MLKAVVFGLTLGLAVPAYAAKPKDSLSRLIVETSARKGQAFPYAEPTHSTGHAKAMNTLVALAALEGYEVAIGSDLSDYGLWGITIRPHHIILLNPDLSEDGRIEVLLHELTHVLTPLATGKDADVIAQAVAYVVST